MAKRSNITSIYEIGNHLKHDNFLPIYYLAGSDFFTIDSALKAIEKKVMPQIESDFDKEVISAEKGTSVAGIIDIASAFPFGQGKKLLIVKNFNKISDRKKFASYVNDPADQTILIATHPEKINSAASEPFASLNKAGFLFEAEELKGPQLVKWLVSQANKMKMKLEYEYAATLVDMVGEEKSLLEMHLQKFLDYIGEGNEITLDVIKEQSSITKQYSIFDLQDSIGSGQKSKAVKIVLNLLENGNDPVYLITMLTKYIGTVANSLETSKMDDNTAAREIGVSWFYYKKCKEARFIRNENKVIHAGRALLKADTELKTTQVDHKTLVLNLILEIMK